MWRLTSWILPIKITYVGLPLIDSGRYDKYKILVYAYNCLN